MGVRYNRVGLKKGSSGVRWYAYLEETRQVWLANAGTIECVNAMKVKFGR
jgi:hypothetical protein